MTSSQAANAALIRSLQRVRDRNERVGTATHPAPIETIVSGPSHDQPKPQWNTSTAYQPTKVPKSVFLDGNQRPPTTRSTYNSERTSPIKVVRPQGATTTTTTFEEPIRTGPVFIQQPYQTYSTTSRLIRTEPEVVVVESRSNRRSFFDRFRRNKTYRTNHYSDRDVLLMTQESRVHRFCKCCAQGRLASACPSCYFCELFYGCPLYCWLLTFLLLLLPMLALFGWLLSEQPAINPAKRRYVTRQSSIYDDSVYDVMRNCAKPYCTNGSPATTTLVYYLTYRDYSVTQITSNGNQLSTISFVILFIFIQFFNVL